jgi:hypothetical protein
MFNSPLPFFGRQGVNVFERDDCGIGNDKFSDTKIASTVRSQSRRCGIRHIDLS